MQLKNIDKTMKYATSLECSFVHIMAGFCPPDVEKNVCKDTFKDNLSFASQRLAEKGIVALIEPLNSRCN